MSVCGFIVWHARCPQRIPKQRRNSSHFRCCRTPTTQPPSRSLHAPSETSARRGKKAACVSCRHRFRMAGRLGVRPAARSIAPTAWARCPSQTYCFCWRPAEIHMDASQRPGISMVHASNSGHRRQASTPDCTSPLACSGMKVCRPNNQTSRRPAHDSPTVTHLPPHANRSDNDSPPVSIPAGRTRTLVFTGSSPPVLKLASHTLRLLPDPAGRLTSSCPALLPALNSNSNIYACALY